MKLFQLFILNTILLLSGSYGIVQSRSAVTESGGSITEKELEITMSDGAIIRGTLSVSTSKRKSPLLILVSPPVTEDRDMISSSSTKISKTLADEISQVGYNVFRFDNRGMGNSTGEIANVTLYSHADDVEQVIDYFKKSPVTAKGKIGLLGFSEGGATSEVVASRNPAISFLVLLSVQGYGGYKFYKYQTARTFEVKAQQVGQERGIVDSMFANYDRLSRQLYKVLEQSDNPDSLRGKFDRTLDSTLNKLYPADSMRVLRQVIKEQSQVWMNPQQIALRKFDPQRYLVQIHCPVLALCGTSDELVDCEPNLAAIRSALTRAGNSRAEIVTIPNVTHGYRTIKPGRIWELRDKDEQFSPEALIKIRTWLEKIRNE
jgi:pimeloyl-ACP methyl ester carboxylesterase